MPTLLDSANSLTKAIAQDNVTKLEEIYQKINNHDKFLQSLLEDDETGYCPALYVSSVRMVRLLATLGVNWSSVSEANHFRNAIGSRAWKPEELPIVKELVEQGVNINEPDDYYNYPLTAQDDLLVVKYFIRELGADLHLLNKSSVSISAEWKIEKKKVLRAWSKQYLAEIDPKKQKAMLEDDFQPILD